VLKCIGKIENKEQRTSKANMQVISERKTRI